MRTPARLRCRMCIILRLSLFLWIVCSELSFAMALAPKVTAREAELLEQASGVAATNVPAALALLKTHHSPDASAALDFAMGNFLFQDEAIPEAVQAYQAAIEKWPAFRDARKNLGRAYVLLNQDRDAVSVFQDLITEGVADSDCYLLLGHALMMGHDAIAAETAYRSVLLHDISQQDARRGLIQALIMQERLLEARNLLRAALENNYQDASLWSLLANVEVALEMPDEAIQTIETARRLDACGAPLLCLLGDLYLDADRTADAVACYQAGMARGTVDSNRMLRAVDGLIRLGEADHAAQLLSTVRQAAVQAEHVEWMRLNAEIAVLEGQRDRAIDSYRELVDGDPLNGRFLLRLGELLQEQGRLAEAELVYERAGRLPGFQVDGLIRRARLAVDEKRLKDAIALLEAAQVIDPKPDIGRYLGQLQRMVSITSND